MNTLEILLLIAFLAIIISQLTLYSVLIKKKIIPWTRIPTRILKMLLNNNPKLYCQWDNTGDKIEIFPHDRKLVLVTANLIKPGIIICIGTKEEYDKYLVAGQITNLMGLQDGQFVYSLNVDYLGRDSDKKNFTVTYNL